ncbi:unnamed protein product [Prunus armeniaca]|uniref:Secreted protein n=1 Tax=Prunus armeniaca TaxID=36596 RepID=A0A6J5V6U6_PRUAR|nr:unnamed protein product [Prunus armeniaca]CAB4314004.1 unnamed protein product [Prunus armeniaca]
MHICQLCILLAAIWLCRFYHEASTMMRDIPSLSFLCAAIHLDKQTMLLLMGNSSSPSLVKIQRKL